MEYQVRITTQAKEHLQEIRDYITHQLLAPDAAKSTLMLIGATHGQETEGVAAILNLISVLETGADLRGRAVPAMLEPFLRHNPRLILIPVYNVDGRARCVPDSMIGEPPLSLRYHGQGTWKDGGYCGWPECKKVHPIREHADHLGSYFNDDGVNLMLDNFFVPMAEETKALLRLCDEEAPECTLVLHGGSNITNVLIQPEYVPVYIKEGIHRLALDTAKRESALGLPGNVRRVAEAANYPPPAFYLPDAIHHITGGYVSYYESNEGLLDRNAFTPEEILLHHYCLFASMLDLRFRPDGQVL